MPLYYNGHTYVMNKQAKTWVQARDAAIDSGGYLAKITSAGENTAIFNLAKSGAATFPWAPDGGDGTYVWIGANDRASEGNWKWSDGSSVSFNKWGSGPYGVEPDNYGGNQDAAGLALTEWPYGGGGIGVAGEWNDINATNQLYSVFEYSFLRGTSAGETINGGSLGEDFRGYGGADILNGKDGDDVFTGGTGKDIMDGGANANTFKYNAVNECGDIIKSFNSNDEIQFKSSAFGNLTLGTLGQSRFVSRASDHNAQDSGDRFVFQRSNDTLWYDKDGDGSALAVLVADFNDFNLSYSDIKII